MLALPRFLEDQFLAVRAPDVGPRVGLWYAVWIVALDRVIDEVERDRKEEERSAQENEGHEVKDDENKMSHERQAP